MLQVEGHALFANAGLVQLFAGIINNSGKLSGSAKHVLGILTHRGWQGAMAESRALAHEAIQRRAQQVLPHAWVNGGG